MPNAIHRTASPRLLLQAGLRSQPLQRNPRPMGSAFDGSRRDMETVRVTNMDWLVGDIRKEFGNLMRAFRARGGRMVIDGRDPPE